MKTWYLTREGANCIHKGVKLAANKKVLLDSLQAETHNKHKEFLVETSIPSSVEECALASDYDDIKTDVTPVIEEDNRKKRKDKSRETDGS